MSKRNEDLVRRAIEEIVNQGRVDTVEALYAEPWTDHPWWSDPIDPITGGPLAGGKAETTYEVTRQGVAYVQARFPELRMQVDDLVAAGDKVTVRWTSSGTHVSGKKVSFKGIDLYRLEEGRIVEVWTSWDRLGLAQQLGVAPGSAEIFAKESQLGAGPNSGPGTPG